MPLILLAALFGVLEGVTEWLPISSTGHLILMNRFVCFPVRPAFFELFQVAIQLGAILAVVVLYAGRLNPLCRTKTLRERADTWCLWAKVVIAVLPSALVGLLLDDLLDTYLYRPAVVAAMLIVYGVAFVLLRTPPRSAVMVLGAYDIGYGTAFLIGCFQLLSLVPGTSRSGATVLGGLLLGLSRTAAAEFSFFLAIPTMLGATLLKTAKFFLAGDRLLANEWAMLGAGMLSAFFVSLLVIRTLLDFVKRHSFAAFGVYRIVLGIAVLAVLIF